MQHLFLINPAAGKHTDPTWIARTTVRVPEDSTVQYVTELMLNNAGLDYTANTTYVSEINGLAELDNGPNSGWMYRHNGTIADEGWDSRTLRSGDTLLPAGASTDVCPANCLPYLLDALSGGYLTEQNEETLEGTPCLRLSLDTAAPSGAPVQCAVWLDKATLIPLYGEFSQNGQVVLTVKMLSFTCRTEG